LLYWQVGGCGQYLPALCRRHTWEQKKLEASLSWLTGQGKMLENGNDQAREQSSATIAHPCAGALGLPPSSARCVKRQGLCAHHAN